MDNTLISLVDNEESALPCQQNINLTRRDSDLAVYSDNSDRASIATNVENLFPSPGIIIRDIYDIFKANKPMRERDSAIINYIKLLFQK